MAEEVFRFVEIGGSEYRIEKFSPVVGLQLARLTLAKLTPAAEALRDQSGGEALLSALCAAISALTDAEVESLVTKCLRFCCKKMKLGWAACVDSEGGYGVAELAHDPVAALALCAEALKWGLGDFFGESASSLLGALFAPSSPRRP